MSLAINPLEVVSVIEPTVQIKQKKLFAVFKGGSDNTYYNYAANSFSTSQAIWNINVPSENIFIDRKIYIRAQVQFDFVGDTPGALQSLLQSGFDAPRAYPLSNAMNTLQMGINNGSVSINMSDIIQGMMRYVSYDEQTYELTGSPNMLDQSQAYEQLQNSMRNPLNSYIDSVDGAFDPRGAFSMTVVNGPGGPGAVSSVLCDFCEPLMISPLHFNRSHAHGFIGVKQLNAQIVWNQNLGPKMWSHASSLALGGSDITSLTVSFPSAPQLLVRTINPSEITALELPELTVYPYHDIQRYITSNNPVIAPGVNDTRTTQDIQLSVVPRRLIIFVRRPSSQETINTTNTFFSIDNVSINFGNRSGLLSSASKRDLYNISKKNGCNLTWSQWSAENMPFLSGNINQNLNGPGSVLALYIPEDIALTNSDLLAPGVSQRMNLQITVTYTNHHPTDEIAPEIITIVDNEGLFTISEGLGLAQIGVLRKEDVLESEQMQHVEYEDVLDLYGGDFFSDIGMFLKKLPGGIADAASFVKEDILPIAKLIAPLLGLGKGGRLQVVEGSERGGYLTGGRKMGRQELQKRVRRR